MKTRIQKWGNSLGVRIPRHIAEDLSLANGSSVEIFEEDNRIIIEAKNDQKLSDILALITDGNIHDEEFPISMGNEAL